MERREFIKLSGAGMGTLILPITGNIVTAAELLDKPMDVAIKKQRADVALNAARVAGASYADVRIGRYLNQFITTRDKVVNNVVNTESAGIGIRVIANGTWGFASTSDMSADSIAKTAKQAVAIAKANSKFQTEPVKLAPVKGVGEVSWKTPIVKNAFEIPIKEKADMLIEANNAALSNGANFIQSIFFLVNEQKYFASTDGSYIDQDVHRMWAPFFATAVGKEGFKQRTGLGNPVGMGFEYMDGKKEDKIYVQGANVGYKNSYDIIEDATNAGKELQKKLKAKSVKPGKYDLVLDPAHLMLTIHESVGHPLELDRVLGYEANFAGTSFATLDKWRNKFQYGSDIVNLVADKTQDYSLANVGYDDEGVKTKEWDLVKDGVLVNYQAIRDQVHMIDQKESHGCCYSQSWRDVQFQRMPNVSLQPNLKEDLSADDIIKGVEKGIYIAGRGSFSIDQQRYNFQFGGQLFYEIKDGKIVDQIEDVAYQSNTTDFWKSCVQLAGKSDYRMGGSFFDGKGQPPQVSAVSHGCPTTRFNNINVLNTKRKV